ncbi:MAG: ABC transporter ATP-binding protein [Chloroflexi bacterium]|nr:ABC transporter ATP-binding protein [Chloroflexota bacterium]
MTAVLRVQDVVAGYGEVEILHGVSITVSEAEIVAIIGPNGAGKSTLLNAIGVLDSPDSGEVWIAGRRIDNLGKAELAQLRLTQIGFVFQAYNLLPVLSAQENVELPLVLAGASPNVARARAIEKLELGSLEDRLDHLPAELSGGQQQRVAIARALANDPAIVWGDELTGNLDSTSSAEIMELLTTLNKEQHQTFVIVTHSEEIGALADRIVRMNDGMIVDDGNGARDAIGVSSGEPYPSPESSSNQEESSSNSGV